MDLYHYLQNKGKIEVKQHLYRFCFKLGALPHPDGLLVSGSVLHLTSVMSENLLKKGLNGQPMKNYYNYIFLQKE